MDISKVWYRFSANISENIDKKTKSNILLVEVDGDACVDAHNKKGEGGQDEQFWRRKVAFRFAAYSHNKKAFSLRQWFPWKVT